MQEKDRFLQRCSQVSSGGFDEIRFASQREVTVR